MTKEKFDNTSVIRSSGNIFEDMGLPNPEELLVKANLIRLINKEIKEQGWTQKQAAKELETTQPKISALSRGKINNFSVEKLMLFLTTLGNDVTITVKKGRRKENKITVPKRQHNKKAMGEVGV